MSETTQELPKYNCIKQVHALKIKEIVSNPNNSIDIFFEDANFTPVNMEESDHRRKPVPNDSNGWYYIVYKDGYTSFSPADVFEEGYVLS